MMSNWRKRADTFIPNWWGWLENWVQKGTSRALAELHFYMHARALSPGFFVRY
jgi:hypothetical protein